MKLFKRKIQTTSYLLVFLGASHFAHSDQNISLGDTTNPSVQHATGNCPQSYFHNDLNGDGYEQNGECWQGVKIQKGNVGIGTSQPSKKLVVHSDVTSGDGIYISNTHDAHLVVESTGTGTTKDAEINLNNEDVRWKISNDDDYNSNLRITNYPINADGSLGPLSLLMYLDKNGKVGIGTNTPAYKLHVNGTAAGTSWTNLSSRDFKKNIKQVEAIEHFEMLDALMKAKINKYDYKDNFGKDQPSRIGFIAEEMPEEVLSSDKKGIDIYELLTYSIGAIKAQQKQIEAQNIELLGLRKLIMERDQASPSVVSN